MQQSRKLFKELRTYNCLTINLDSLNLNLLSKFLNRYAKEKKSLQTVNDVAPVVGVFAIIAIGLVFALFYVPSSLKIENFKPSDLDKLVRLPSLISSFRNLCFAITLSLAQIPLEFLDSSNQKLKRNLKTILVLATSIFAFMAFLDTY